ncbi:MAG: hypothetical protein EBW29_00545, partial [Candidatus Fonsibacter ubiquis]|nr:hypothetical protein [Candidatus Fonsibacter ubiquis]
QNFFNIINNNYFKNIIHKVYKLKFFNRLNKVKVLNKKLRLNLGYIQLISILLIGKDKIISDFLREFKLSNKDKHYLNLIYKEFKILKKKPYNYQIIKRQIYFYKKGLALDFLNFIFCLKKEMNINTLKKYRKFIKRFKVPRFPITGNFLMKKGFKQGLELGKKLDFLKNYWIKNNFKLNLKNI